VNTTSFRSNLDYQGTEERTTFGSYHHFHGRLAPWGLCQEAKAKQLQKKRQSGTCAMVCLVFSEGTEIVEALSRLMVGGKGNHPQFQIPTPK